MTFPFGIEVFALSFDYPKPTSNKSILKKQLGEESGQLSLLRGLCFRDLG